MRSEQRRFTQTEVQTRVSFTFYIVQKNDTYRDFAAKGAGEGQDWLTISVFPTIQLSFSSMQFVFSRITPLIYTEESRLAAA